MPDPLEQIERGIEPAWRRSHYTGTHLHMHPRTERYLLDTCGIRAHRTHTLPGNAGSMDARPSAVLETCFAAYNIFTDRNLPPGVVILKQHSLDAVRAGVYQPGIFIARIDLES